MVLEIQNQFNILQYAEVPFYNDKIFGAHTLLEGQETVFIPIAPLCEILRVAKQKQIKKIKTDAVLAEGCRELVLPSTGGNQKTFCLRYDLLPMWLTTIQVKKVKLEYQEKIILYRKEVAKVLAEYFLGTNNHEIQFQLPDQMTGFIREIVHSTVKNTVQEISSVLIDQIVKTAVAEIHANNPLTSQNDAGILKQIASEFEVAMSLAKCIGLSGNQAILAASKAIKKIYDYDPLVLLEINLASEAQEKIIYRYRFSQACQSQKC